MDLYERQSLEQLTGYREDRSRGKRTGKVRGEAEHVNNMGGIRVNREAQEPRHISHGEGVEASASIKGARSIVQLFFGSVSKR